MKKNKIELNSELLILPDGRIFVQNLTQPMAELLRQFNPRDKVISPRAKPQRRSSERKFALISIQKKMSRLTSAATKKITL